MHKVSVIRPIKWYGSIFKIFFKESAYYRMNR